MTSSVSSSHSKTKTIAVWLFVAVAAAAVLLVVAPQPASGDPIEDSQLKPYRAGWFSNVEGKEYLTCSQTCTTKAKAVPEHEASGVPTAKRAFVCRATGKSTGWLYGSQFDDRAACYTVGLDLKGSYSNRYMCLCVAQ